MFGFDPPDPSLDDVRRIAAVHWDFVGEPTRLRGERSHNTRLTAPDGTSRILQIQSASEEPTAIDLQTSAMRHLERVAPELPVSRVVPTTSGEPLAEVRLGEATHLVRLVTFLPGTTFDPEAPLPAHAYRRIGDLLGRVAVALGDFEHPAAEHFMAWDLANGLVVDPDLRVELSSVSRAAVESIDDRLRAAVETMTILPRRTIHNDGHAGNLVRADAGSDLVRGIIDFGDLVRTVTAADVAIIAESFAPDHPDPAVVLASAAAGYHLHVPLTHPEIGALCDLVLVRASLSVLLAEFQIRHAPHLANAARAGRDGLIARLERWARLDVGAMTDAIHTAIESGRDQSDRDQPAYDQSAHDQGVIR